MAESNINIYLGSEDKTGTPAEPIDKNEPKSDGTARVKSDGKTKTVGALVAKQAITTAMKQGASRAGEWHGSNQLQNKINAAGELIGTASAIAIHPAIGLSMLGISTTFNLIDYAYKQANEQRTLEVLRGRTGSTLNRSRRD